MKLEKVFKTTSLNNGVVITTKKVTDDPMSCINFVPFPEWITEVYIPKTKTTETYNCRDLEQALECHFSLADDDMIITLDAKDNKANRFIEIVLDIEKENK